MKISGEIPEKYLAEIWKEQRFVKEIVTEEGDVINVIFVGDENVEVGGPDFRNARIKIGNVTYVGDIEIDTRHSDWKAHGHNVNKRFNKVILHATYTNEPNHQAVYSQDGRRIPSFSISRFIDAQLIEQLKGRESHEEDTKTHKIHCNHLAQIMDDTAKYEFLFELGLNRFKHKSDKMIARLKELLYLDSLKLKEPVIRYEVPEEYLNKSFTYTELNNRKAWEQLFYEGIFEALGYSQNKAIMRKLAESVDMHFFYLIKEDDNLIHTIESLLFNASGLLPQFNYENKSEISDYVRNLHEKWLNLRKIYNGRTFSPEDWHFFKLRPQNFPTIRLAGGARIIFKILRQNLIGQIIKKFEEIFNYSVLTNSIKSLLIIHADGYWAKHYVFEKKSEDDIKYFVGSNRVDEILVNVILPYVYVYFEIFDKKKNAQKVLKVYSEISLDTDNSLVKEISDSLQIDLRSKKSIIYQGMIELFRNYCSKEKCTDCKIGDFVFNESN